MKSMCDSVEPLTAVLIRGAFRRFNPPHQNTVPIKRATLWVALLIGGLEGDRTLDLTDANRTLIPAELRAHSYLPGL